MVSWKKGSFLRNFDDQRIEQAPTLGSKWGLYELIEYVISSRYLEFFLIAEPPLRAMQ